MNLKTLVKLRIIVLFRNVQGIKKYQGVRIFTVTTRKSDFFCRWKKALVDDLCRYRVIEHSLKHKILDGEEFIYSGRYFVDEDIERTKTGQNALRLEAKDYKELASKVTRQAKDRKARTCSQ